MRKALLVVLLVCGASLAGSAPAQTASNLTCTGFVTGGTYNNVVVPAGMSCDLDGAKVLGNVTVQTGSGFELSNTTADSTVAGNVTAKNCDFVELESTGGSHRIAVGGDFTATGCTGNPFSGAQGNSAQPPIPPMTVLIGGNTKCDNDAGGCVFDYTVLTKNLDCSGNFDCDLQSDAIGGDATLKNNSGVGISVDNNIVGGNLACSGNPAAGGSGNTVAGNETGQCAGF